MDTLSNAHLAELLARAAEEEEGHRARALRRAGRAALQWPEEAAALAERGASLLDLRGVGPWVAGRLHSWLDSPPELPEPPQLRSGFMTMAEARSVLEAHPEWRAELRADLQMHTTWSDGSASLAEMAELAAARGYRHAAVTDHSKGLPIARGMDEPTLLAQGREIEALNRQLEDAGGEFRVLRSLEMNLSPAGEGDMDLAVLAGLDLVLGAFHSKLRVTEDQTQRYLAAVANPSVHVLAHPRGRRWGARAGLRAEWDVVFEAAAAAGMAVEIDAFPDRQDLDVALAAEAARAGAWISIGTDAHHPDELGFMDLGLAIAIRAGVPRDRVLNFLPREELLRWAARSSR